MKLVHHHTKYQEIHGVDETILITQGEHVKLHRRLRREGKCKVPPNKLRVISERARGRVPERRIYVNNHHNNNLKKNSITFRQTLDINIRLIEKFVYYPTTGNVCITGCFESYHGNKLFEVDI